MSRACPKPSDGQMQKRLPVGECPSGSRFGVGIPNGIRTRAAALKGRCPRPLDDGGLMTETMFQSFAGVPGLEPRTDEPESPVLPITPYPKGFCRPSQVSPIGDSKELYRDRTPVSNRRHDSWVTGILFGVISIFFNDDAITQPAPHLSFSRTTRL